MRKCHVPLVPLVEIRHVYRSEPPQTLSVLAEAKLRYVGGEGSSGSTTEAHRGTLPCGLFQLQLILVVTHGYATFLSQQ